PPSHFPPGTAVRYISRVRWVLAFVQGGAVRNETVRGLRAHPGGARPFALLLLLTLSVYSAYGLSPLMTSQCACQHDHEVPCDCPHHGSAPNSPPAPCQLHGKTRPAANLPSQPCLRARCGSIPPHLILVTVFSTAERPQLMPPPPPVQRGVFRPLPP